MTFSEWQTSVPNAITGDALWKMKVYRLALFASDACWEDIRKISNKRSMRSLSDQLYRAMGSVSANIAEGYSRGTGKDRARFYEYALGSARESRDWYYKARHVLGEDVSDHRLQLMSEIIRLLLTMIPKQRGKRMREPKEKYKAVSLPDEQASFLEDIPMVE
ncbi:MAG: four helix bundle protein [Bacteroidetes bacterium QH_2_67_10]|nr:MAG: four helix bundle protein [Bacteroidetes bacterium QH_2_67_10]